MFLKRILLAVAALSSSAFAVENAQPGGTRPQPMENVEYSYLEEVEGAEALQWVHGQNNRTFAALKTRPEYQSIFARSKELLDAKDRIPTGSFSGDYIYNFWQDAEHPRGILRRSTRVSYLSGTPEWELVLDIDALGRAEGKSWVYKGYVELKGSSRALVTLSPGGTDAAEVREFDLQRKSFVEGGFRLPEAKSDVNWVDINTVIAGSAKDSATSSGYPRTLRLWKRDQTFESSKAVYSGQETDVGVFSMRLQDAHRSIVLINRAEDFYEGDNLLLVNGEAVDLALPRDVQISEFYNGYLILRLKSDWKHGGAQFKLGSVVGVHLDTYLQDRNKGVELILAPNEKMTIEEVTATADSLYIAVLENVRGKGLRYQKTAAGWEKSELALPQYGSISFISANKEGRDLIVSYEDFLTPTTHYYFAGTEGSLRSIYSLPARFDASKYAVEQHFAISKDGTRVPYFVVAKKGMVTNGENPTLLYGYGGFEISLTPSYLAQLEHAWLSRGGVYVLANIRGGGEFGPAWHQAALQENRQRAFDDFIAIGEDLIERKITTSRHLGIMGGSNGGLLVGTVMTQRPDLFNAVVVQVPLLDMMRFHKLLAGASWIAEYGNPEDPKMAPILRSYSPFHNVFADKQYPTPFFMTSTRDDRVHPGHARRMAAKMEDQGHPFFYYENTEGGHGGSADNTQRATWYALQYTFLISQLH